MHTSQRPTRHPLGPVLLAMPFLFAPLATFGATPPTCSAQSTALRTPVIELYTSEGCSSCPPADQWLSALKGKPVVAQAFHVSYWDYIGWVDRFATAANNARQRELGASNRLRSIYTPQLVRDGRDWRDYDKATQPGPLATVRINLQRGVGAGEFEARVEPQSGVQRWSAYWTVTEDGHQSRVKAGENAGATLKHDFVVRQYVPVGQYEGAQSLKFYALSEQTGYARRVNLVVFNPSTLEPLQALSLMCRS